MYVEPSGKYFTVLYILGTVNTECSLGKGRAEGSVCLCVCACVRVCSRVYVLGGDT